MQANRFLSLSSTLAVKPLTKDCDHRHLARDVAAHVLLEFSGLTGDASRDYLLTFSRNSPPQRRNCLRGLAIDANRDAHGLEPVEVWSR